MLLFYFGFVDALQLLNKKLTKEESFFKSGPD